MDKSGSISTEELVDALKKWNIPVNGVLEQLMKASYCRGHDCYHYHYHHYTMTVTMPTITMTTLASHYYYNYEGVRHRRQRLHRLQRVRGGTLAEQQEQHHARRLGMQPRPCIGTGCPLDPPRAVALSQWGG